MSTEKTPLIYERMAAVMKEVDAIGKDSTNQQQGFKFRSIDSVYASLHNILAKHEIFTLPIAGEPVVEERTNRNGTVMRFMTLPMTYRFATIDGSFVEAKTIGESCDSADKSAGKAASYAFKTCLIQTFTIPVEGENDPDFQTHELQPKEQPKPQKKQTFIQQLKEKLVDENITRDELLETLKWKNKLDNSATTLTEEQAKDVIEIWGYVSDDVAEWRKN